jgi:hypothetical protein
VSLDKKGKPSVTHTRFLQQRENLQQTLVRKLLARYIDANPEFSIVDKRIWHELQQPTDLPVEPIKQEDLSKLQQAAIDKMNTIKFVVVYEVDKFMRSKRVTNDNIQDLDKKIGMSLYLREKGEAIIEDRKELQLDVVSNVDKVRAKYIDIVKSADDFQPGKAADLVSKTTYKSIAETSAELNALTRGLRVPPVLDERTD